MKEYKIVKALDTESLEFEVTQVLKQDWQIAGGVCAAVVSPTDRYSGNSRPQIEYYQAMIRE